MNVTVKWSMPLWDGYRLGIFTEAGEPGPGPEPEPGSKIKYLRGKVIDPIKSVTFYKSGDVNANDYDVLTHGDVNDASKRHRFNPGEQMDLEAELFRADKSGTESVWFYKILRRKSQFNEWMLQQGDYFLAMDEIAIIDENLEVDRSELF